MQNTIEVVYESGIFRPLKKVDFKEGEKAKLIVEKRKEKGIITLECTITSTFLSYNRQQYLKHIPNISIV